MCNVIYGEMDKEKETLGKPRDPCNHGNNRRCAVYYLITTIVVKNDNTDEI